MDSAKTAPSPGVDETVTSPPCSWAMCLTMARPSPVPPIARLVARIIPADAAEKPHLSALSTTGHISPVIACDQALLEVTFMRDSDLELLEGVRKVLTGEADAKLEEHIAHREDVLDNVQREVTESLGKIMVKRVPVEVAERAWRLLRMTDELESVSDEAATILKVTRRLRKGGLAFSESSLAVPRSGGRLAEAVLPPVDVAAFEVDERVAPEVLPFGVEAQGVEVGVAVTVTVGSSATTFVAPQTAIIGSAARAVAKAWFDMGESIAYRTHPPQARRRCRIRRRYTCRCAHMCVFQNLQ